MAETTGGGRASAPPAAGAVRVTAAPTHRRWATAAECGLGTLILGLAWAGGRALGTFWPYRGDPEVADLVWRLAGVLGVAVLTLAWLIVFIHDLVKLTIEVGEEGLVVDRLWQPFQARWDEVREIGLVRTPGQLTLRSRRGTLTVTERLLGAAPFATLADALSGRAPEAVREWSPWAAARRQFLLLAVPALGMALLLVAAGSLWRRRAVAGWPRLGSRGRPR